MRAVNTHGKSKYENGSCDNAACQVEMKRSGMQEGGKNWRNKTGETAESSDACA